MARDEERGMSLRRKLALAAVFFFFVVLLISSLFGKKGLIEIYRARKNYETLQQEIKDLEAEEEPSRAGHPGAARKTPRPWRGKPGRSSG